LLILQRQDLRARIGVVPALLDRKNVDAVRPITSGIDQPVGTLVADKKFVLAKKSLSGYERLPHTLFGEASNEYAIFTGCANFINQ
jgi:hypothetical protein